VRIDLPVLLPEVPDARDACVRRLQDILSRRDGILRTHVVEEAATPELCIHFDADVITVGDVERLAKAAGAGLVARYGHGVWPVRLIAGEDAGRRVEAAVRAVTGVATVSASVPAQSVRIEYERQRFKPEALEAVLREVGAAKPTESLASRYQRHRELISSLVCGALLAIAFALERRGATPAVFVPVYLAAYAFGAFDLVRHTVAGLTRGRFALDIDLLMLLAAVGAAALGAWAEGAFLLFLFSLAHALEHFALGRARASIRALSELAPATARVQRGEQEEDVPVEQVAPGDRVVVRPAERVPVDGRVVGGQSAVDQAPITGESVPVDKANGDEVFAGTINGEGVLTVETTKASGDRTLDRVIRLVEEAQAQKAPTQVFTERFERIFVPTVLVAAALVIVVPPLLEVWDWSTSFYRAMALLVAASPCALALGTPATVLAGVAQAARRGVLVKGGMHLENLGTVQAIALDKTGTLTVGRPEVTDIVPAAAADAGELLRVAAAVERQSAHPLAAAVVRRAEADGIAVLAVTEVESVTGRGIRAVVEGQRVAIGNRRLFDESEVPLSGDVLDATRQLQDAGRTVMVVRHADRWLGVLGLADRPRPGAANVLRRLRDGGIQKIVMLTGDHQAVGEAIGREVGVDEVRGELLPEDKVTAIKALLDAHGRVAMVGDGVNDAPALAQATVGIAMGGAGTAAALETADAALMADDLGRLPFAIGLSRSARRIIRQNVYIALIVIAALIVATTTGTIGLGPAVFVHEGSTLVVIANALRLLGYEDRSAAAFTASASNTRTSADSVPRAGTAT
jgi:Cd2+/Zn2+-exporting ATPase